MNNKYIKEFCVRCGSILPLPSFEDDNQSNVQCPICQLTVPVKFFNGRQTEFIIEFNQRSLLNKQKLKNQKFLENSENNKKDADGPIVERICNQCGYDQQTFATLQTRSADEGQTIFYTCMKCGAKETENS